MVSSLAALDLDENDEVLYRRLLRTEPQPLDDHAAALRWSEHQARTHLNKLISLRLVRVLEDSRIVADDPRAVLVRVIETRQSELDGKQRDLATAKEAVDSFSEEHVTGRRKHASTLPMAEIIAPEMASSIVEFLNRTTHGEISQVTTDLDVGPGVDPETRRTTKELKDSGRIFKTIYDTRLLDDTDNRAFIDLERELGEDQRVLDGLSTEFVIFAEKAVVTLMEWGNADGQYLLVRDPSLVRVFREWWTLLWERAQPIETEGDEADRRILSMLNRGHKDDFIARTLQMSLRTVRRRIASLMVDLGVETRFQLGVQAARRGLLD